MIKLFSTIYLSILGKSHNLVMLLLTPVPIYSGSVIVLRKAAAAVGFVRNDKIIGYIQVSRPVTAIKDVFRIMWAA